MGWCAGGLAARWLVVAAVVSVRECVCAVWRQIPPGLSAGEVSLCTALAPCAPLSNNSQQQQHLPHRSASPCMCVRSVLLCVPVCALLCSVPGG